MKRKPIFAAGAAFMLSACTSSLASYSVSTSASRELTADEKKVIADSLLEHIREPERARYLWAPLPADAPVNGLARYCAAVNAKSQHPPYNGLQPYLVQVQISNGRIVSSVVGSIAGGSDGRIVRNLCARHGLNPDHAA
ncbi:MAG TPA: lipoprotein [Xanthobacteraceae bacterium]|nr:lipoprotein [Xanthobacteraceae bacterium]